MNPDFRTISVPVLSRRQFGLIVGGGAALLVAGGTYGAVSRSSPHAAARMDTAFGSLSVTRAGRLARLDAQGRQAFRSVAAAAAHLSAPGASAGSAAGTLQRTASLATAVTDSHGHDGGAPAEAGWPQPVNLTWGDVVLVEVELSNSGPEPVLFSPGQLRLKLASSGTTATTVTPQDADRTTGTIPPGAMHHHWISYLAPSGSAGMELEYTDPWQDRTQGLSLPPLAGSMQRP
ncbi:hypothetical protein J2809_000494 [Arthrobacter pascens]|uniref:DUF4352 domain-containing protein n=1 Tax=Arthrobacter pascens TaxID=1677 RepID=UPI00285E6CF0|nr:DUF4352 domain-containing protein [Arthrobacter pascens]MDR6556163.1 hypothetical protein [Arthrobacter pascens]